jgi:hypothetical protein
MNDFVLGERVLITRAMPSWSGGWLPEMTRNVGKTGVVESLSRNGLSYYVLVGVAGWWYPQVVLVSAESLPPGHGPGNKHLSQELPR